MRFKERGGEFKKNGLKIWFKTKPKRDISTIYKIYVKTLL